MNENMESNINIAEPIIQKKEENVLAGIIGAFLFALAGGVLWFVLYQVGFLAAISGIVAVICAIKGYAFFAKGESIKGIVISVIVAFLVIALAWYLCLTLDVYNAHKEWFNAGEIDYMLSFAESFRLSYLYLVDPDVALGYWGDLAIGVLLCVVGCIQPVRQAVAKAKANSLKETEGATL
ncbi:MAG: hypothetical protein J6K88_05085 [Oscillospiraceae bacterium]|nr:hypothetical protein [Oscillospiraceae bacterium]